MHNMYYKNKEIAQNWFIGLQQKIMAKCCEYEKSHAKFKKHSWTRKDNGGGGVFYTLEGETFEQVSVNVSTVHGRFEDKFLKEIPGAVESHGQFWAGGISLIAHMNSPFLPIIHLNTRLITTSKSWFGGGIDVTPIYYNHEDCNFFHGHLRDICDRYSLHAYDNFSRWADKYFFLPHRNELRGIGGIFFDDLNTQNWDHDFQFVQDVGTAFLELQQYLMPKYENISWTNDQKEYQLYRRGRYIEFNLLYDRGTRFGLMTDGNIEAIFASFPPNAKWGFNKMHWLYRNE
ncbi:MAG: coproporphyrinogen III oxidase, aerobic [Candidatus Xenolissoclinum pacificiensis L6]|uniref:coproporphyrinogen oxidase n=1 Tax=Candidatus Xenolissoclinum pacificiensis L6 TaxID=1401685 RepID=W2UYY8_9RICK|nr:MAG: coproporphyrinogen III oxidase, aerobic [Candidatus Xenolissoclinum pacificiensis L6]